MATCAVHLEQALHNKNLAMELTVEDQVRFPDWAIIIAFYSAVHYLEAFFAEILDVHSDAECRLFEDHQQPHLYRRDNIGVFFTEESAVFYIKLYELSMVLRYLTPEAGIDVNKKPKGEWLKVADVKDIVIVQLELFIQESLKRIKREIA